MKVLVISQYFYPENFRINNVVQGLVKLGHDVTVLTGYPNYPKSEFFEGYGPGIPYDDNYFGAKIIRIKMHPRGVGKVGLIKNYWSFWHSAKKWVKKNAKGYDVTYSCQLSPVFMCLPNVTAKKKYGIPMVINVQDIWPESFEDVMGIHSKLLLKPLEIISNRVYKNSDILLCSSNAFIDNMKARGINEDKLIFWPQYSKTYNLENLDCPTEYDTKYIFVFAGNVGDAQGLDIVIESARLTLDNHEIGYYIIGDGSEKENLQKIVNDEGLTNVKFIDRKPEADIPAYLVHATASMLTLKESTLSKTVLPAKMQMYMACGSPIVTTIQGEASKVIGDAKCGLVGNDNTAQSFARIVQDMTNLSEIERQQMASNAIRYNNEYFNEDKLMQILDGVLQQQIQNK